jgi:ElaB/YqjD/DUF883 family membrane-anchored ribosome-binding protein
MKTKISKYYTGLVPKRGCVKQFKALDAEIRELNSDLTHYVIQSVCGGSSAKALDTKAKIAEKLEEIKQYALTEEEQYVAEQKKIFKELHADPNYSDLGAISDAIKNVREEKDLTWPGANTKVIVIHDHLAELEAEVKAWRTMFSYLKYVPEKDMLTMTFKPTKTMP